MAALCSTIDLGTPHVLFHMYCFVCSYTYSGVQPVTVWHCIVPVCHTVAVSESASPMRTTIQGLLCERSVHTVRIHTNMLS